MENTEHKGYRLFDKSDNLDLTLGNMAIEAIDQDMYNVEQSVQQAATDATNAGRAVDDLADNLAAHKQNGLIDHQDIAQSIGNVEAAANAANVLAVTANGNAVAAQSTADSAQSTANAAVANAVTTNRRMAIGVHATARILNLNVWHGGGVAQLMLSTNTSNGNNTGASIYMVRGLFDNAHNFDSSVSSIVTSVARSGSGINFGFAIDSAGFLTYTPSWAQTRVTIIASNSRFFDGI